MNLGGFHRHVQGGDSEAGGRVLPAALPPLGERRGSCPACSASPWRRRPTPSRARPSPSKPTGAPRSWGKWGRERPSSVPPPRTWRASRGCSSSARRTWCGSGSGRWRRRCPWRSCRHRHLHHRPGAAAPLGRLGAAVRGDEPGEGQAVLPLEGRRHIPVGDLRRAGSYGRRRRGSPSGSPAAQRCTAQITSTRTGCLSPTADLNRRKRTCEALVLNPRTERLGVCGSPLWQADKSGPARYPLSDYVKHHMRGFFDLLIGDEVHEFKARGSAQGIAAGVLAEACGKSLSLTGTLLGGYASTIFHLLYRFSPEIRTEFGRSDEGRWIKRYGFEEHQRRQGRRRRTGGRAQQPPPQATAR